MYKLPTLLEIRHDISTSNNFWDTFFIVAVADYRTKQKGTKLTAARIG